MDTFPSLTTETPLNLYIYTLMYKAINHQTLWLKQIVGTEKICVTADSDTKYKTNRKKSLVFH